ncbi:MAG: class I SAM-dependent methyltransferase [Chloroflexales bacterium]|nr:class I SAM-dependent methyltransferase [Chloroflexales bacterium]
MECVHGKQRTEIDRAALDRCMAAHPYRWIDLGTGDGRYVQHLAAALPRWLVIGVDACREPLRERSRRGPPNAIFAIANALALPPELDGLAHRVSVNFPWGSLLVGLIEGDGRLLDGLGRVSRPQALLDVHLNGGAFAELGLDAEQGAARVSAVLTTAGWRCAAPAPLGARQLRSLASTWAHRLAHGPRPWAITVRAVRLESGTAAVRP